MKNLLSENMKGFLVPGSRQAMYCSWKYGSMCDRFLRA